MNLTGQPVYSKQKNRRSRVRTPKSIPTGSIVELHALARKKGTDKQFRHWISHQPSCISGRFSEWVDGTGRCEAAHVRRAGRSGTGYKAEYSCVPLTRQEHARQHQHGESDLAPKEWWDAQMLKYLRMWISS